jgi:hypothetical protein
VGLSPGYCEARAQRNDDSDGDNHTLTAGTTYLSTDSVYAVKLSGGYFYVNYTQGNK